MQTFSTAEVADATSRLRYWREISSDIFFGIEVSPLKGDPFDGDLTLAQFGAMRLARAISAPAEIGRTGSRVRQDARDLYFLHLQIAGRVWSEQLGTEALLEEGDFVLFETGSPYRLVVPEAARTLVLSIPGPMLRAHLPSPQDVLGQKLAGGRGVSALLGSFLHDLWRRAAELEQAAPDIVGRLGGALLDLYATAAMQAEGANKGSACAGARRAQIRRIIEANLRDPDLGLSRIAAELGASQRYVRKLFEGQDETIMERVLRRRLEECARQLRDPMWRRRTATEIAFSWGFNSSSHFSLAFKNRFGVPPREYRRRALGAARCDGPPPLDRTSLG